MLIARVVFYLIFTNFVPALAQKATVPRSPSVPAPSVGNGDSAMSLMASALKAEKSGDLALAQKNYENLLSTNSNLTEYAHFFLGSLLLKQQNNAEAKNHFQKLLDLSPNLKLMVETRYRLAQIFIQEKNYAKAKAHLQPLEKKSRRESQYADIIFSLAKAEIGLGNSSNSCKWLRKLYSRFPEYPPIKDWGLNLADNKVDGMKTKCTASNDDHRARIRNLQFAGQSEEAQREINELKNSKYLDAEEIEMLQVQFDLHEGEVTKALNQLLSHHENRKDSFSHLMMLASAAARAGEMQAAVGSYYRAFKIGGRNKLARQALYQSAFLSYQFQDYDGAYRRFQEFMKAFPNSGLSRDAQWHMAWIRYLRADYEGAYKSLTEIRQVPHKRKRQVASNDRITYWMGMSLFKQKKYEEAKTYFESLTKEQLTSYYSIAAQHRMKKIESILPKRAKKGAQEATRRLSRFSIGETLMPSEEAGFSPVTEESESEESLAAEGLRSDGELMEVTDDSAAEEAGPVEKSPEVATGADDDELEIKTSFSNPVLVKRFERARDLMVLGLKDWAKWDLYDIERKTSNKEYLKTLMSEYESVENFQRSSYIGQVSFSQQRAVYGMDGVRYLWEHTYPRAYSSFVSKYTKKFDVPQELVWGIMRAESQYKKDIVSPVGALGLMQVMPNTGLKISQLMGEKDFKPEMLLEPEPAIKIGARYLSRLMKKFESSVPLVAAGYNAGPHRVKGWLVAFGELDMDEFVEHIPFLETRNYVKKVVSNFFVYNQLYGNRKDLLPSLAEPNKVRVNEPVSARETWEDN